MPRPVMTVSQVWVVEPELGSSVIGVVLGLAFWQVEDVRFSGLRQNPW